MAKFFEIVNKNGDNGFPHELRGDWYIENMVPCKLNLTGLGECTIEVYEKEQKIPHFHIVNENGFDCKILLFENYYYSHDDSRITLTDIQLKELDSELRKPSQFPFGKTPESTIWTDIIFCWNALNYDEEFSIKQYTKYQPDYTKTAEFKI